MHDVRVIKAHLPARLRPGIYWPRPDGAYVLVQEGLDPREERFVIEHEMAHHRRGGGIDRPWMPRIWRTRVACEERHCDRIAAEAIVPVTNLASFCDRMADLGEGVGPDEVMAEYDVSRRVAEYALDNLTAHERGTR